jgi:hypothetical protein
LRTWHVVGLNQGVVGFMDKENYRTENYELVISEGSCGDGKLSVD